MIRSDYGLDCPYHHKQPQTHRILPPFLCFQHKHSLAASPFLHTCRSLGKYRWSYSYYTKIDSYNRASNRIKKSSSAESRRFIETFGALHFYWVRVVPQIVEQRYDIFLRVYVVIGVAVSRILTSISFVWGSVFDPQQWIDLTRVLTFLGVFSPIYQQIVDYYTDAYLWRWVCELGHRSFGSWNSWKSRKLRIVLLFFQTSWRIQWGSYGTERFWLGVEFLFLIWRTWTWAVLRIDLPRWWTVPVLRDAISKTVFVVRVLINWEVCWPFSSS